MGLKEEIEGKYTYSEESPSGLFWVVEIRSGRNRAKVNVSPGDVAGAVNSSGYYQTRVDGKLVSNHRIIWTMQRGEIPKGVFIDHIDRNKLNNKIDNLRLVTPTENLRNMPKRKDNSTGMTGVQLCFNQQRSGNTTMLWRAKWNEGGKQRSKSFSVLKYGFLEAEALAIAYRTEMIEKLNRQGAGYTEIHGT